MKTAAVVTGAGRGIGRSLAVQLAVGGRDLVILSRTEHELLQTARLVSATGASCSTLVGDAADPATAHRLAELLNSVGSPVDLLINNAGVYGEFLPFVDGDMDLWISALHSNVVGTALCTRAVLPDMLVNRSGRIINVVSRAAIHDDSDLRGSAYAVSKAAVTRFTTVLAHEIRDSGVVVFGISPGMVDTRMTAQRPDRHNLADDGWTPVERTTAMVDALASGRYDALHGRLVHARDDLDQLLAAVDVDPRLRRLTVSTSGPGDPFA